MTGRAVGRRARPATIAILAVAGLAAGGLAAGAAAMRAAAAAGRETEARAAGASGWLAIPAPDYRFATLEGDSASLRDYRGRIVLVNFWGSWCAPCLTEIPHLAAVQRALREVGGTVVGPAVESGSPEEIRRFADRHGMTWPLWVADHGAAAAFGAIGYPFTLLVDADGIIRRTYVGAQTEGTLLRDVRALRRRSAPS